MTLEEARQVHVDILEALKRGEQQKVTDKYGRWVVSRKSQEACVADYDRWIKERDALKQELASAEGDKRCPEVRLDGERCLYDTRHGGGHFFGGYSAETPPHDTKPKMTRAYGGSATALVADLVGAQAELKEAQEALSEERALRKSWQMVARLAQDNYRKLAGAAELKEARETLKATTQELFAIEREVGQYREALQDCLDELPTESKHRIMKLLAGVPNE